MSEGWGKYQLQGTVASGATGTVYVCYQQDLARHVAIKELSPALAQQPGFLDRFRAEAQLMTRLDTPNCVRVYDFFEADGRAFLVEEFIEGATLRGLLDKSRLTPEQALGALRGGLGGLAYAHSQGLVHRDFKPENVLIDRAGVAKVGDFGQALGVPTATGAVAQGTPAYMSPEQVNGASVDYRSDVYSAGCVLYELLVGRQPFVADSPQAVMRMHLEAPVPDPRDGNPAVPDEVAFMVGKALTKDPATRLQSATDFYNQLNAAAAAGFGADWESRSSIQPLLATPAGGAAVAATPAAAAGGGPAFAAPLAQPAAQPVPAAQAVPGAPLPKPGLRLGTFVIGVVLSVLLVAGGLGFGGSKGVLPASFASATGNFFGQPGSQDASGPAFAAGNPVMSALMPMLGLPSRHLIQVWATFAALVAGVCMLLETLRGLFRRLRARRLAARGQRLPGKFLVPAVLYLGVIGGLIALAVSGSLNYLWDAH